MRGCPDGTNGAGPPLLIGGGELRPPAHDAAFEPSASHPSRRAALEAIQLCDQQVAKITPTLGDLGIGFHGDTIEAGAYWRM
jgi:hypothetical protein